MKTVVTMSRLSHSQQVKSHRFITVSLIVKIKYQITDSFCYFFFFFLGGGERMEEIAVFLHRIHLKI